MNRAVRRFASPRASIGIGPETTDLKYLIPQKGPGVNEGSSDHRNNLAQAVGLMTVTPHSGWYYGTVGNSLTEYNSCFVAEARISFFEQVLPQYLTEATVTRQAAYYLKTTAHQSQASVDHSALQVTGYSYDNMDNPYSFGYWPTPVYPKCTDYVFMVVKTRTPPSPPLWEQP
jgi:hypothetical protein